MSLILKGIDLPKEEINLTITKDGRIYLDNKYHLIAVAIQIPKGHGAIKDTGEIIKLFRRVTSINKSIMIDAIQQTDTILEQEE